MNRLVNGLACASIFIGVVFVAARPGHGQVVQNPSNGHYYNVVTVPFPPGVCWSAANTAANLTGGYLATITSASENAFVTGRVNASPGAVRVRSSDVVGSCIGGYQATGSAEPAGGWRWGTNEPLGYANWYAGQPDNGGGGPSEGVMHYYQRLSDGAVMLGLWNDVADCDLSANTGYVIEWDSNPCAVIMQQPASVNACIGDTVSFSVALVPASPFIQRTYQWYQGTRPMSNGLWQGGVVSGAQTSTLTITNVSAWATGSGSYTCAIGDPCGGVTTMPAVLSVRSGHPNGTWSSLSGVNGRVSALGMHNNDLIIGGQFTTVVFAPRARVAGFNGYDWYGLGTGVDVGSYSGLDPGVNAIGSYNGLLYVAGGFANAGGGAVNHIAAWNGSAWLPLIQPSGIGLYHGPARAMKRFNNTLAVGGVLSVMPASLDFNIYTGSGDPTMVGQINWGWGIPGGGLFDLEVRSLAVFSNQLVAGGRFLGGGGSMNTVRRFDGNAWQSLSTGMDGRVNAVTVFDGAVVAGGLFGMAGGVPAANIARWNGSAWEPLGLGVNGEVRALAVYDGELVVGGDFTIAGAIAASRVARWSAANSWRAMGTGTDGSVYALMPFGSALAVGGQFQNVGGNASPNFGLWTAPRACLADINCSGAVDSQDFFDFLTAFFGGLLRADFNGNGAVNSQDYFDFVAAFFVGC